MKIRKKWLNQLKNFFNKHFKEYYLASFCWWIPSSCENHCTLIPTFQCTCLNAWLRTPWVILLDYTYHWLRAVRFPFFNKYPKEYSINWRRIIVCRPIWKGLKGLSHDIDLKNFDKNLQNLALLWDAAVFLIFRGSDDFILQNVHVLRLMPVSVGLIMASRHHLFIFGKLAGSSVTKLIGLHKLSAWF